MSIQFEGWQPDSKANPKLSPQKLQNKYQINNYTTSKNNKHIITQKKYIYIYIEIEKKRKEKKRRPKPRHNPL